jgi:hypothetical protein
VNLISRKQASSTGKAAIPSKCRMSGMELLELISEMVFSEVEKGSWGRLTQTYVEKHNVHISSRTIFTRQKKK